MQTSFHKATLVSLLALIGAASPKPYARSASPRLVHQFPAGVWVENIAVRPNGNLLLTTLTPNASLYEIISPAVGGNSSSARLRFTTASANSFFGIAELSPDRFAILGGNHTATAGTRGEWAVWTADFLADGLGTQQPREVARLSDAVLLNGASAVPGNPDLVLAADSTRGVVLRVNVRTGEGHVTQDLPEMKPREGTTYSIGINGLRIRGDYLYFTNAASHALYRIRVNADGSTADGATVETVDVLDASFADDFDFGPATDGTAWVATNYDGSVVAVSPAGQARVAAGGADSSVIPSDTSCRFGRTALDANVLYVTTAGTGSEGAKVVAVDVGTGTT